jgi:4a-hydroxytetrahydrobiopterin dehydratase
MKKLTKAEIEEAVVKLPGWSVEKGKLHREFRFGDFVHAFGFMATAAMEIEKRGHHPEWTNVYDRVTVDLTTHEAGGITAKDVALAELLNAIAAKMVQ